MEEVWKKLEKFNLYEVSNLGRIKHIPSQRFIGSYDHKKRLLRVSLVKNKKQYGIALHTLVWEAFGDTNNIGRFLIHKDKDPMNCCIDNLEKTDSVASHIIGRKPKIVKVKKEKIVKEKVIKEKVIKEKIAKPKVYTESVKAINRDVFNRNFNNGHYINNNKLTYEIILSIGLGKPTEKLKIMLYNICFGLHQKLQKDYPMEYRFDILTDSYIYVLKKYNKYDYKKYDNAIAYFTEVSKRALAHSFNTERFKTNNYQTFGKNRFISIDKTFGY